MLRMIGRIGLVQSPIGSFCPAGVVERARRKGGDSAGKCFSGEGCNEVKARSWPSRPRINNGNQPPYAAQALLLGQPGDFGIDRVGDLFGD